MQRCRDICSDVGTFLAGVGAMISLGNQTRVSIDLAWYHETRDKLSLLWECRSKGAIVLSRFCLSCKTDRNLNPGHTKQLNLRNWSTEIFLAIVSLRHKRTLLMTFLWVRFPVFLTFATRARTILFNRFSNF